MPEARDRTELRQTFDSAADRYHRARPRYPSELFALLAADAGIGETSDLLEIGPATGIATEPLAELGHRITAIELGPDLADAARANLAGSPSVNVITGSFDTWEPERWGAFDLVFAATAWHWLDPSTRYERAHRHLRPGGHLAVWSANHVVPDGGDPIFAELQPTYDELGESMPSDAVFPRPGELPDLSGEIEASGCFTMVAAHDLDWEIIYTADAYIDLLDTFSGHIAMGPEKRAILDADIRRRVAARPDAVLRRHWGLRLHIARRRN